MFSGAVRWFNKHVLPVLESDVSNFFGALKQDAATLAEHISLDTVQSVVDQLTSTGTVNGSALVQAAVDELKKGATATLLPDAEHALVGMIVAAIANNHANVAGAIAGITGVTTAPEVASVASQTSLAVD